MTILTDAAVIDQDAPPVTLRQPQLGKRIPALDGLRGIAILIVIQHHWTFVDSTSFGIDHALAGAARLGWVGVELFFVLSGFLITGILLDSKQSPRYLRNFYARRTLRIFPLYYAFLFVCLVLLRHMQSPVSNSHLGNQNGQSPSTLWYWLYASNFLFARRGFYSSLDGTWSLAIEEQFYLLWPLIVLWLNPRALLRLCIGLIGMSIALRACFSACGISYPASYVLTPSHLDGLAVGAIIALVARRPDGVVRFVRPGCWAGTAALIAFIGLLAWTGSHGQSIRENLWTQIPVYALVAIIAGAVLMLAICLPIDSLVSRFLTLPILGMFGRYSYAMYLFHQPIGRFVTRLLAVDSRSQLPGNHLPLQVTYYAIATTILILSSWASWQFFESKVLQLKRFFPLPSPGMPVEGEMPLSTFEN